MFSSRPILWAGVVRINFLSGVHWSRRRSQLSLVKRFEQPQMFLELS